MKLLLYRLVRAGNWDTNSCHLLQLQAFPTSPFWFDVSRWVLISQPGWAMVFLPAHWAPHGSSSASCCPGLPCSCNHLYPTTDLFDLLVSYICQVVTVLCFMWDLFILKDHIRFFLCLIWITTTKQIRRVSLSNAKCWLTLAATMTHPKVKQCWCVCFCIHPCTCWTSWPETTK